MVTAPSDLALLIGACFLFILSTLFYRINQARSKARELNAKRKSEKGGKDAPIAAFFDDPAPLASVTPEMLSGYQGERDHIYVNKVLRHPYHQTMAHQPMQAEDWLEIDAQYVGDLQKKAELIRIQGKVVMDIIDDDMVRLGCEELLQNICQWLVLRYPGLFRWQDSTSKKVIHNLITDDIISLFEDDGKAKNGIPALHAVSRLVQDDFLIASPIANGHWLCAGGLVCFPGFYLLSEKINTTLFKTHEPVPQFNEKLLTSVERTLTRLEPSKPIERTSWEIVDSQDDQFWVPMAGPLPTDTGAKPMFPHHVTGRAKEADKLEDPSQLVLRLDHQTFVKMPKSGIVFFGVHPFRRKLEDLRHAVLLPRLLLDILRDGPDELMKYKAAEMDYREGVIPYLKSLDAWQAQRGLFQEGDRSIDFRKYWDRVASV